MHYVTKRGADAGKLTSTYEYVDGGYGTNSTTPLVKKIAQNGVSFEYEYDTRGNITGEKRGDLTTTYQYDALGQLIRVNDPHENATWIYNYDRGGNITSKVKYAYTTDAVGTAVETIPYVYGDSNWKDKLTCYDGQTITYDAIGNPTNDGTWTYTWQAGRQLKQMSAEGTSVSFKYDHNGMRVQKVVEQSWYPEITNYLYHNELLTYMTINYTDLNEVSQQDVMHFYYDSEKHPMKIRYNGVIYAYISNLQGDIIGLIDSNGLLVVEYKYDAWGRPLSTTGSLADTLGRRNPFRYRGYIYDEEICLYCIKTRCYNVQTCRFLLADESYILLTNAEDHNDKNLYAYCDNNPLSRKDEDGDLWCLIGAAVGALISGGMELVDQLCSGKSIEDVNWKKVGVSAASGAASGFVASTGVGLIGQVGLNAGISAATYAADAKLNGEEITMKGLIDNAVAGGISGLIGGRGANVKGMRSVWNSANKGITRELRRRNVEYAAKRIAVYTARKTTIKRGIAISVTRYTVGGAASRGYVRRRN